MAKQQPLVVQLWFVVCPLVGIIACLYDNREKRKAIFDVERHLTVAFPSR